MKQKKKISNTLTGRKGNKHTNEVKKIISLKNSGENNGMYGKIPGNAKQLLVFHNGKEMIFNSMLDCVKYFEGIISIKTIRNLIDGKKSNKAEKLNIKIKLMDKLPEKGKKNLLWKFTIEPNGKMTTNCTNSILEMMEV